MAREAGDDRRGETASIGGAANMADTSRRLSQVADAATDMQRRALSEFSRMFAEMKVPAAQDLEALAAAHRRNVEALAAANRVALEGAQALLRRNVEITQQAMSEMSESVSQFSGAEPPYARAARQAELLKKSYERAVTNMRELSDLIQRSNGEALGLLNQRFTAALDEVRGLMEKAGSGHAGGAPGGPVG